MALSGNLFSNPTLNRTFRKKRCEMDVPVWETVFITKVEEDGVVRPQREAIVDVIKSNKLILIEYVEGTSEKKEFIRFGEIEGHGVELGKLAFYYALQQEGPHTVLVGMNRPDLLNSNLDVYYNGLTEKEKQVYNHVQNNILSKLKKTDWEGIDVARYWEALKA